MKIEVRKMDLSDIPFVYKEEMKIFGKSLGEKTLYNEIMYNDLWRYFIALIDGKRAGYVGSWITIPNAEILNLFVKDKYRGNNLGKMLIDEVVDVCKLENVDKLTLEVRVSNTYAIKMYENSGFKVSHTRKNYYSNNEDAYLMIKDIEVRTWLF